MQEHPNAQRLAEFYAAFDRHDGAAMSTLYAPEARFHDPVFQDLSAGEPAAMWRMLTARAADLRVELVDHDADDAQGNARWIARYPFVQTGRPVVNDVRSTFRFHDGLVVEQRDDFSFYAWSKQALGTTGLLFGWTPLVRGKVQRTARDSLQAFRQSERA